MAAALALVGMTASGAVLAETAAETNAPASPAARQQDEGGKEAFTRLFKSWKTVDGTGSASAGRARRGGQALAAASRVPARLPRSTVGGAPLTSGFGMRLHPILGVGRPHLGVDLAARTGAPVFATADGVVTTAGSSGGYGLLVALDHSAGMQTRYGHLSRLNVSARQRVRKGDVIGFVGATGLATGPHLHYETRVNGRAVDPVPYIERK